MVTGDILDTDSLEARSRPVQVVYHAAGVN